VKINRVHIEIRTVASRKKKKKEGIIGNLKEECIQEKRQKIVSRKLENNECRKCDKKRVK
jgi:hypothetical protein